MSFLRRHFASRPIANDRSITLLKLLHTCPQGDEERAQVSNQVPRSSVLSQTCQYPCLLRLALPLSKTLTHQVFLKIDVWHHACFLVPFYQTSSLLPGVPPGFLHRGSIDAQRGKDTTQKSRSPAGRRPRLSEGSCSFVLAKSRDETRRHTALPREACSCEHALLHSMAMKRAEA